MNDLYARLKYLFPDLKDSEILLLDLSDGLGPTIKEWRRQEPEPTIEQLKAITSQQLQAAIAIRNRKETLLVYADMLGAVGAYKEAKVKNNTLTFEEYITSLLLEQTNIKNEIDAITTIGAP